jgi:hypothetical protein
MRRFPFGFEPVAPPRGVETAPLAERLTMPLDDTAPRRPALPFPEVARSADAARLDPLPVDAPWSVEPEVASREVARPATTAAIAATGWRRRTRVTFFVLGVLLYAAVLVAIVAPDAWWP